MNRNMLLAATLALMVSGCCCGGLGGRCGDCGPCSNWWGGYCGECNECESGCKTRREARRDCVSCRHGCGETYIHEWISDPPDCCDPCDHCGNWVGSRCCPSRPFRDGWRNCCWGRTWDGGCDSWFNCFGGCSSCSSCTSCGGGCSSCGHAHPSSCSTCESSGHIPVEASPIPRPMSDPFKDDPEPASPKKPSAKAASAKTAKANLGMPKRSIQPVESIPGYTRPGPVRPASATKQVVKRNQDE